MKLLHKLLPVATIASVAAVVTPLVTSCSSSMLEWNYVKNGTYSSRIEQAHMTKYYENVAEVEEMYLNDVGKNRAIIADDILCAMNYQPLYFIEGSEDGKTTKMYVSAECTNVNVEKKELSIKFKYSLDTVYYVEHNTHYKMELEGTIKNLKYELVDGEETNEGSGFRWVFTASYFLAGDEEQQIQYLKNDHDWSVSASAYMYFDSDEDEPYEATNNDSANYSNIAELIEECEAKGEEPAVMQALAQVNEIGSHYLEMIDLKE